MTRQPLPYFFETSIRFEGKAQGTPEQIKQYLEVKIRKLISEMKLPEQTNAIKMHAEPGVSNVFRKITSDGYEM